LAVLDNGVLVPTEAGLVELRKRKASREPRTALIDETIEFGPDGKPKSTTKKFEAIQKSREEQVMELTKAYIASDEFLSKEKAGEMARHDVALMRALRVANPTEEDVARADRENRIITIPDGKGGWVPWQRGGKAKDAPAAEEGETTVTDEDDAAMGEALGVSAEAAAIGKEVLGTGRWGHWMDDAKSFDKIKPGELGTEMVKAFRTQLSDSLQTFYASGLSFRGDGDIASSQALPSSARARTKSANWSRKAAKRLLEAWGKLDKVDPGWRKDPAKVLKYRIGSEFAPNIPEEVFREAIKDLSASHGWDKKLHDFLINQYLGKPNQDSVIKYK